MNDSSTLIPERIAGAIAASSGWADGDTWVLGNGRVAEFDLRQNAFIVHDRRTSTVLGTVAFRDVMARGRLVNRRRLT